MLNEESLGLRERKKRATRAALAGAAVRLAAEHGAENVTVEAISQAAGVSPRTFFNYFDSHDDAFVMIDHEAAARVRERVLSAPAELSPLGAVREALAQEFAEVEGRREYWRLRARVLQRSPRLLARIVGVHMADERGLAQAIAERLGAPPVPAESPPGPSARAAPSSAAQVPGAREATDGRAVAAYADKGDPREAVGRDEPLGLYPRLLAATSTTAVRVALQHWSAHETTAGAEDFADVFRRVFDLLAIGLANPEV